MSIVLAFDPSGNWSDREGEGTTGWALFRNGELDVFSVIRAADYKTIEEYWDAHTVTIVDLLKNEMTLLSHELGSHVTIVCESFKLQPGKAKAQSWSSMETSQLIGYLRMFAWERDVPFILQDPSIKTRFSDEVLEEMGIIERKGLRRYIKDKSTTMHERDAIRHGMHFERYGRKKL